MKFRQYRLGGLFMALAVTVLILSGCASTSSRNVSAADLQKRQQALARSDLLIVPGNRIGPVRLGMAWDEVIAMLGKPDFSYINTGDPTKISTQLKYFSLNMEISFDTSATPSVTLIRVLAYGKHPFTFGTVTWAEFEPIETAFHTDEGIGLGASSFEVARKYGSYESNGMVAMDYKQLGLYFIVTKDHRIWSISTRN